MPCGQGHRAVAGERDVRPVFRKDPCWACGEGERMAVGRVPRSLWEAQSAGSGQGGDLETRSWTSHLLCLTQEVSGGITRRPIGQ